MISVLGSLRYTKYQLKQSAKEKVLYISTVPLVSLSTCLLCAKSNKYFRCKEPVLLNIVTSRDARLQ